MLPGMFETMRFKPNPASGSKHRHTSRATHIPELVELSSQRLRWLSRESIVVQRPGARESERSLLTRRERKFSLQARQVTMWWWWLLLVMLLDARMIALTTAECRYDLTFFPSSECLDRWSSSPRVSVLVELGNEEQEFVMWGQSDLPQTKDRCGETTLRLASGGKCLAGICQMRLIRFFGSSASSSSDDGDWLLRAVRIQTSDKNLVDFNVTGPISVDGQASVGSCVDSTEEIEDYGDEVGDIDWS
ncbi:uncharacterized protein LOC9637009 isoform X2 [Selaginella moellendorffii]|uniref:uncharacterized protein LOC9637009 isoform X2 n=1 Tax=Selaginella moellendorffii TaxID=88036 RepID=UPI000D1C4A6E|nr:uncharacterized protein LOC9637009 isoform X2 [Selaginella moellendorffii]|eukprot:XP_024533518.1 uncharacterized protein LOC9637009 isoform X2 [Selaginella moellendorffii]